MPEFYIFFVEGRGYTRSKKEDVPKAASRQSE
jgi:hypothetical protein